MKDLKKKMRIQLIKYKSFMIVFDVLWSPLTLLSALWLKPIRKAIRVLPVSNSIFMGVGLLPVLDHYYQPVINPRKYLKDSRKKNRNLPGIKLDNDEEQLALIAKFHYNEELLAFPMKMPKPLSYHYDNSPFGPGDAEYLYNIVRHFKSKKIIEIGCGYSTLMIDKAVKQNKMEDATYECNHICIEPYENSWLQHLNINLIRQKVEDVDLAVFKDLEKDDILFIDSTHMIRPQGDVLFEYLQLLPILKSGVIIHIHDIFTPNEYPDEWLDRHLLWNEQYLLEAFLSCNNEFTILGSLNNLFLKHNEQFLAKSPVLAKIKDREPASFWMVKN